MHFLNFFISLLVEMQRDVVWLNAVLSSIYIQCRNFRDTKVEREKRGFNNKSLRGT